MTAIRKPDFFIVGAPKCGTTALSSYLADHPEIFMAPKEPHHFGKDLILRRDLPYRDFNNYMSLFSRAEEPCLGEASVWYLYSETAAREIYSFNPDAKIIVMIRNPVDYIYSLYYQMLKDGNENLATFEGALSAEGDRKAGGSIVASTAPGPIQGLYYTETARFTQQISRYVEQFGADRIKVVIYDDLFNDTASVYKGVLRFLGVNESFSLDFRPINENRVITKMWLWRVLKFSPQPAVRIWRAAVPAKFRGYLLQSLHDVSTSAAPRPPMNRDTKTKLEIMFRPEVARLSKMLNRDLMYWVDQPVEVCHLLEKEAPSTQSKGAV